MCNSIERRDEILMKINEVLGEFHPFQIHLVTRKELKWYKRFIKKWKRVKYTRKGLFNFSTFQNSGSNNANFWGSHFQLLSSWSYLYSYPLKQVFPLFILHFLFTLLLRKPLRKAFWDHSRWVWSEHLRKESLRRNHRRYCCHHTIAEVSGETML